MAGLIIHEYDHILAEGAGVEGHTVPPAVFAWLEEIGCRDEGDERAVWLRPSRSGGRRAVQVTSFVGVIRAPGGFQIEVLPKVGRATEEGEAESRKQLIEMLRCLNGFRHVRTDRASIAAERMPLLEVFIREFLLAVEHVVKRGLRSAYVAESGQLSALRGKLLFSEHLKRNVCRADRFYAEYDIYSQNRPENRLIRAALRQVLSICKSQENQKLGRELSFVFSEVPESQHVAIDFQRVGLDRGMSHYEDAIAWTKLILEGLSPLVASGKSLAPSLLFPMAAVFEAFVAKHLAAQVATGGVLKSQVQGQHLVEHLQKSWFRLKPDLLIRRDGSNRVVLDTKWKLLDVRKADGKHKYQLSQSDFYQLHAYGQNYLDGEGDVVLIYPRVDHFESPLPVFHFPKSAGLRLWVLPFCLKTKRLALPEDASLSEHLVA